jgi:hypothetical protein
MYLKLGSWWSWSYGSWIYNYLRNQCLWPQKSWVGILLVVRCTRYNIMSVTLYTTLCQWHSIQHYVSDTLYNIMSVTLYITLFQWHSIQHYVSDTLYNIMSVTLYTTLCQWHSIQHYVSGILWFPPPIKRTAMILTEILLKVPLNIIPLTLP